MLVTALWLLSMMGCRYQTLDEVDIHGATAAQEAALRAELLAFDEAVGPGRVRISGVWVEDLPEGRAGLFRRGTRRLSLDERTGLRRDTLVHELCHALDADEDLWRDPLVAELAEGLFDEDYPWAPTDPVATRSKRARQREAFAAFCETSAVAAHALARPCDDDPDDAARVGRFYRDEVFVGLHTTGFHPLREVVTDGGIAMVWPTENPDVVVVLRGTEVEYVELTTGALVAEESPLLQLDTLLPPPGLVGSFDLDRVAGSPEGPFAARMSFWLHHLGHSAPRWVGLGAEGWSTESGACDLVGEQAFAAGGGVWLQHDAGWTELVTGR
jgi:hypothetical protein